MATEFSIDNYLNLRATADDKLNQLQATADNKANELAKLQIETDRRNIIREQTLSGKLGLTPGSVTDNAVNIVASGVSGAARTVGNIISAPVNIAAGVATSGVNQSDIDAFDRYQQNTATPDDLERLNFKSTPDSYSRLEDFQREKSLRDQGQAIQKTFDFSGLVDQSNREGIRKTLSKGFEEKLATFNKGIDQGKEGDIGNAVLNVAKGLGGLLVNAGDAIISNKQGVFEYAVENTPQILLGLFGPVGVGLMTTNNVGYAIDVYHDGFVEYAKTHDGKLPPLELQKTMATKAFTLALAEQVGDLATVGAIKALPKTTGTGVVASAQNTAKAIGTAAPVEAGVEGFQTKQEGDILGKPASALDIVEAATIGGAAAGTIVGGIRVGQEAVGATPEKIQGREEERQSLLAKAEAQKKAIESGDITGIKDTTQAIGALFGNSQLESTTPEAKKENLKKADDLLNTLEATRNFEADKLLTIKERQNSLDELITSRDEVAPENTELISAYNAAIIDATDNLKIPELTPKEAKAQRAIVDKLDQDLISSKQVRTELDNVINGTNQVDTLIGSINTPSTPEANTKATDTIISLSMRSKDQLDKDQAKALADNFTNALTTPQRAFLRAFSEARIAENLLQTSSGVTQDILNGSKPGAAIPFVGIRQYRDRITSAILKNNKVAAIQELGKLKKFTAGHNSKATAAEAAIKNGLGTQIVPNESGGFDVYNGKPLSVNEIRKAGGLTINSARLVQSIRNEANALNASVKELEAAIAIPKSTTVVDPTVAPIPVVEDVVQAETTQTVLPDELPLPPTEAETEAFTAKEEAKKNKITNKETDEKTTEAKQVEQEEKSSETISKEPVAKVTEDVESKSVVETTATKEIPVNSKIGGGLNSLNRKSPIGTNYQGRELIADQFTQVALRTGDATSKPLVVLKNFLSQLSPNKAKEFLGVNSLTDKETSLIKLFKSTAESWFGQITKNLPPEINPNFRYQNPIQFLIEKYINIRLKDNSIINIISTPSPKAFSNLVRMEFGEPITLVALNINGKEVGRLTYMPKGGPIDVFVEESERRKGIGNALYTALETVGGKLTPIESGVTISDAARALRTSRTNQSNNKVIIVNDIEENIKTAITYAAFSYVIDSGNRSSTNTDAQINRILHRDENTDIENEAYNELHKVGTSLPIVVNSMGRTVVQALGLKANKDTPVDVIARLETSLGAHVFKILHDQGIVKLNPVQGDVMQRLMKIEPLTDKVAQAKIANTSHFFVSVVRDDKGKLPQQTETIIRTNENTHNVLDRLFSVETVIQEPSLTPTNKLNKLIKGTNQKVPSQALTIIEQENNKPLFIKTDMYQLMSQLSLEAQMTIAGAEQLETVQASARNGTEAKNNNTQKSIESFMNYVGNIVNGVTTPLYFNRSMVKSQRIHVDPNIINVQANKFHRFMMKMNDWDTEININNVEDMNTFFSVVGESFGLKPNNNLPEDFLQASLNKIESLPITRAVNVLVKMIQGESMTPEKEQDLIAGVLAGKEDMHALDGLMALAQFQVALEAGNTTFTTNVFTEVDGTTNGIMLTNLLHGAADSQEEMFKLLNRGGFFELDSPYTQYNQWRSELGNKDTYENLTDHIEDTIEPSELTDSVAFFTGTLKDNDGLITSAGRNISKTPLTAVHFGSSVKRSVEAMAETFVKSIHKTIQKYNDEGIDPTHLTKNLNLMLKRTGQKLLNPNSSIESLMELSFSFDQVNAFKQSFLSTVGKAATETMKVDFGNFIGKRDFFTKTANLTYQLYNAAYTGMRTQYISQQMDLYTTSEGKEGIEWKSVKHPKTGKNVREPLYDLTQNQEEFVATLVKDLFPVMRSSFSKEDKNPLDSGIRLIKQDKEIDGNNKTNAQFGTPLKGVIVPNTNKEQKSLGISAEGTVNAAPGVTPVSANTHSNDSVIIHNSIGKQNVFAIHDAKGVGIKGRVEAAHSLNKATWDTMLSSSPPTEMYAALQRTIVGLAALLNDPDNTNPRVSRNTIEVLTTFGNANKIPADKVLIAMLRNSKKAAFDADTIRLQTLANMGVIDQYSLQGGAYTVTDQDRKDATTKLAHLEPEVSEEVLKDVESIITHLKTKNTAPVTVKIETLIKEETITQKVSPFGKLGTSVNNDPDIATFFKTKPNRTAKEVIDYLTNRFNREPNLANQTFNIQLLKMLTKALDPKLTINALTSDSKIEDVVGDPLINAYGWYNAVNDEEGIYLLGSEFTNSILTPELLLHEMVHAATARKLRDRSAEAEPHIKALEDLFTQAKNYIKRKKLTQFDRQLQNVDEMIAWGMTSQEFQQQVLAKLRMKPEDKPKSGLQQFIEKITALLFGENGKSVGINSGMAALVEHTVNLIALTSGDRVKTKGNISLAMASSNTTNTYSTLDIYNALNTGQTTFTPEFDNQLQGLLGGIVNKLHGSFGSLTRTLMADQAQSPMDIWIKGLATGKLPFASKINISGFNTSSKEMFVSDQVEATVRAALEDKETHTKTAYKQLSELYIEAYQRLKPKDFHKGDWATATTTEIDRARALHDFVFKIEKTNGNKLDYLARFAALGLANQEVNNVFKIPTKIQLNNINPNETIVDKIQRIFTNILDYFQNKITRTFHGQNIDSKLKILVEQLVDIEAKKRFELERRNANTGFSETLEEKTSTLNNMLQSKISQAANSNFITNNRFGIIQGIGGIVGIVADKRVGAFMDALSQLRDQHFKERPGVVAGIADAVRGPIEQFKSMLLAVKDSERNRKEIITNAAKTSLQTFINEGKDLTREDKASITKVLLRTGAHKLLDHFDLQRLEEILGNKTESDKEIDTLEKELDVFGKQFKAYFIKQANFLAYNKAVGINRGKLLMQNAGNIARLYGTQQQGNITETQAKQAEPIIEALVAMYALGYVDSVAVTVVKNVLNLENARTDGNGVSFVLGIHKQLEKESRERLFDGNSTLMTHGFTPEIYNPHKDIQTVSEADGILLEEQGYIKGHKVVLDPHDLDRTERFIYVLSDGGLQPLVSGLVAYDGKNARGTKLTSGYMTTGGQTIASIAQANSAINRQRQTDIASLFLPNPRADLSKSYESNMSPILDDAGNITNWRYTMSDSTKDSLLDRSSQFNELIGSLAGSIYSKETAGEQNRKAIDALKEQFNDEYKKSPNSFVLVGDNSTDPELKEIWDRLPTESQRDVEAVWGKKGMLVKRDLLDITFGYRKESLSKLFNIDINAITNPVEKVMSELFVDIMRNIYGEKAALKVRQGERVWQEIIHEAKDIIVVKSGLVTLYNTMSNQSLLLLKGMNPKEMLKYQSIAFSGAASYKRDSTELRKLKTLLEVGHTQGKEVQIRREIALLEDAIASNPVTELIDAGLMPTIVEDLSQDQDDFSFKSALVRKTKSTIDKLNPDLVKAGKFLYMTKDTQMYQVFSRAAQLSDFVGKYALYKHLTTRKKNPLSKEQAILEASDTFVDYNIPLHRRIQYLDDTGIIMFTKYILRIQRVLFKTMSDNPLRWLSLLTVDSYINLSETVIDSSITTRIGNNPLHSGVFELPKSLDDLATVHGIGTLFKGLTPQ